MDFRLKGPFFCGCNIKNEMQSQEIEVRDNFPLELYVFTFI
jgi:hypothetical protein